VVSLGAGGLQPLATDLAVATSLPDESSVNEALSLAVTMAERNRLLQEELSAQASALEASRLRLLLTEDAEREALETRLRAGPRARLMEVRRRLASTRQGLEPSPADALEHLERAQAQLRAALHELDTLARGLDPALLRERGLADALVDLAGRSPIPVDLVLQPLEHDEAGTERTLFYVASEALANVAKHAQASRAWLSLTVDDRAVGLRIEDDGVGPDGLVPGSGLRGLRDRVDTLGGMLAISDRPGGGTRVQAVVPLGGSREAQAT
jgi:signal transduction histidine kinase